ncbi:ankyrin-2-like isoform X15 [Centruroides vittatus]|uniref:ankyrin-2-like isoform X15 n=1 Tax=Centruroides vittatus TaxID=120091 RepID=UPI00350EC243
MEEKGRRSRRDVLTDGNSSFLRAARAGNLDKVLEWLKGSIDINTSNANGLNALHLASKEGHINVVTELIKRGANVNAATKKGNTALHISSLAGKQEVVKILVQNGANVNVQSQNGFTPLYMAAQENHDDVLSFLLANGANQSLSTEDGFTPLAVALQQGHDKVVTILLENDTKGKVRLPALHIAAKKDDCKAATLLLQSDHNPDVTSKSGFTPLHIAAHYGNENIAMILLEKGADVNFTAKHQITPLHVAAKWGKSNMVALLLEKGAKIGASTRDGLTPLHCAARSGHETVVDQLLENGAPISAKTKNGLAPLHMSSQGDHVDSARILLYHKAPVDDVTVDYLTALHVAAHCGHVNVAKLLLDRNADPNARALNGFTPLHIACKKNRIKVVELLLKHGASIEATTESGLTPLHVASFMGCMNIVIFLLQNGANPDVPTVRGETPLHLAARANQTDIIRILLRNGAHVDAPAREEQTPLHIAARLGNVDIVSLLLQHGAAVDATTKDMYTALHVAAKEGQEEVASVLLDHGASLTAATKKGFTPLHMAAKYGNIKVARLLLHKDAPVDAQGKNGVTPLHVAAHYDHVNVALLLLDKGASPHATAKNGYTPLHIASKKNQMDISTTLLEYGAKANTESKAGFTSLHLAAQEGHTDMATLLIEHNADVNARAKNGLTPLHLCAQEDRVNVAEILVKNGAEIDPQTKAEYSPLHVACHFGQINMVRFLLQHGANVNSTTSYGYTPLHQAAQQGHNLIINLLLENQASPNIVSTQGQTPLSIAQRLGYISVVETLKVVTETVVTTTTTTVIEEKYKVVAPETMQETFMSDSEDDGGEETMLGDQSYRYLTADEMKSLGDDSLPIDVTKDERPTESMMLMKESSAAPLTIEEDHLSPQHSQMIESALYGSYSPDNVDISLTSVAPISAGRLKWKTFLVSFMVDARGGAMRGCRHSGVRVIIPPRKASMPMRITCRYLRKEKLAHPPPLMEGEACASRILEVGPVGARFLGPVIIEVPHFASLRGKEREITILRSDNGETWRDHTLEASEEAVQEVLSDSFDGEELSALEDLNTNRITRILTTDFPQYFAIITRIRQEVHAIGPEGGMVTSTVVPQVQAIFPEGALTKKIKVGLQAQPIQPDLVTKLLGNSVAVSPIVTVEPRRRKFHKPITLTIPVPQAATKGMINQYSGDAPTLRLLCSITGSSKSGGSSKAQWEDVTGSTPLTLVNECISFTTTVSARFWLMDCRQVNEATKFATELYQEVIHVPFMGKFVIFAKRYDTLEAQLRVFCMTDDKEDKTLESQEHFTEIAKSRDVEVLQNKPQYLEFAGNLVPITKSGDQLFLTFHAFRENRLPFSIRIKDPLQEPMGRIAFMKEPKVGRGEPQPVPICNLNIALPEVCKMDNISELVTLEKKYCFVQETGLAKPELIHRADLRLSDIARELDGDWEILALQLDISETEINSIKSDYPDDDRQQALIMLRQWMQKSGPKATGNSLEKALRKIRRDDIVKQCMFNVELVTDAVEKAVAKVHLDQSGFDTFKEELGSSRDASLRREVSLDVSYDEQDLIKETVHMTENGAEIIEKQIVSDEFVKEPAQAAKITQDQREEKAVKYISSVTVETQEVIRENVVKQGATETATTIVMEGEEVSEHDVHDHTAKLVESETWASEMDTSQVSISSLPEDEKSEPTTATISSSIAAEPESAAAEASTEEKEHDLEKQVIPSDQDDSSSQDRTIEEQISEEKQVMEDLVASTLPSVTKETLELALTKRFDENLKTSVVQKKMISDEKVTDISISANKEDIYKITKEKEIISDERKQEEKSPQHVDRGLSPIAVYTAYPGDIRREGSEFFIKTYDAPTMQEPVTSYLGKSIKENIIRSKSISINEDTRPLEILLDRKILDMDEGRATSESKLTLVNPPITKTLDIHFKTESHIRITHRTKDEKEELSPEHISLPSDKNMVTEIENLPSSPVLQTDQASSPINIESPLKTEIIKSPSLTEEDISKGIGLQESFELSEEIYEKSEIATSPMSDHLLDTGVGTESPVTTETASSPFQFETKSVAVSPHDSAADISFPKEDSSTQTTLVDTVSAHTSPMDLSLSFQDALLDQQIQLGVADIESQDEIETPGTEILDDEELEDKFAQESLPETKEQALALKSEAISTQEKLKLMKQNDFERSKDVKLIQTYKFVTTQRKDVDSIDKSIKQETVLKCGKKVFTTFIKEEKVKTDWSEIEDKNVQSKTVEGATSQETEVSVVPEVQGRPSELQGICSTIEPEEEHVGIKLFPDKLEEQKESGKLNSKICVESIEYIPKEKNYEITSLTILEKKCKDSTIKENHLFSVKEKIIEDELNLEKEKQIINKDFKKSIREDPNCLDLTPKTTQFDERYYSPSEVSPAKEINVTTEISTDVGIKSEILKQTVDLLEKSDVYENEINAPTELKNADISETVVLDESKEISQKIGIQEIDSILIKDKTEHLKFENNLEKFEIENQIADDSKLECFEEKNQSLDVVSEKEQIKEYKIDDVSVFQKETFQSTSISSDYKTQHPNSSDYFSEGQTNGFSHSDDYQSYSPDDIPKADVLTRAEVSFPSALDTKESAYENVNKWMEKEMEIVKEMLKDRPDNMPSLENYESIIAFDGDLPTGDDELFKRSSPTVESFDDEAQVEKCDTDLILQMLNNVSCSEIELAEVRTEDEAPDIEEDISPAAEELCNSTLQEFIKEQTVNENFDQGANKEIPEKTTSAQFTSDIYEESELDKTKTKPTLDLYPQSSLEVEIGSHISDDISLDIDKNHVSCSENKIEVQQEKIPNTELLKCDTTSNVKTVLFPTALLKADAIHDSTSDTLTSSTVLSAKLADEASDNIYPQLNLSGKEEIKKESEDQFEVPMKKTEEKEIGIITTDKTTELLEEQTIDTYASPLVKEFQEEEKSEKFQKDKISDISISQSSKVEQYLESRTSEEYNIDLDTEILSKEEKDSSEVVKSLSEIEDKFIESLRVTEEIEIPEPIPDLTVKETTVEEVPEEKITEKQSITEILDSSDYEIKSEIVTITEQCSTKDIIHDAKFDDDSKKLKEEKAKIVEFIEPLSEIKKTEEIQYSKSLPSEVIDKTELLSDDGKKKSVEELIHSKSEMKETLIKETGATESTLLSYDVKTEISKLQEEESVIESIPDITIPESAPCITKQENFEDIKKQDEQKEETAVIDDIMPESTQHEFIDVSDLEDIEPELEIKAQPIVTTPVIERKLKTDRTQRKTHISVADVTEKYADTEVKHTEPIIFEPSDDDKESFGIECHHSTPDFRQMTDIDLEAILEEHAKEEQRRAASESIDTEEHDLTLLDKKEPEDLSVKSPIDIHSPISQSMPPISPPISLPKLDESECHSILSTDIDSCADIKTSHSKSESPLIPDVVDEKIEEQKLISENEYSDQEVFYAEPSSDITDAVQKTTDETSQSSIICEPESEAQIKYRTQMAFDNTAFMGIDNIDVGEAVNREMVRSPYEVVRMKFEDFEIGMTTEQSSVVPEEQVLSEEKISKLEIKEDKYESESVDKSLEIPSREEATKIAQEIIEEIRTEVAKSPLLQNASIKIPDEDDIKTDSQIFASDDKEIMPDMIQSDDGKLIPGEEIFPAEIETSTTKTDEIKPDDKIKELSYEKADETTFPTSKTFQLTKESMEIKESHIFITNGKIEAISSDVDLITDEYDNRQFPVSEEIDYTEDFHSQMSYIGKQDTSTKSVKETESFTSHANLNGPVAVSYIPEYDDETFTIEKIKETDVIDVTKDTFYDISQKSARQDIPESDLMHSENIENAFEESVSASDIKETEIFNEEEYIRTRISISDDQVDQEIKKILSDESQTEDDRLTDIIERPITPEPSDEILEEMLLPESEQLSKLATITQKTISISEEEICVKHTESEMIYPHQNVFSESETDEPTDITVNKFYETALTVDLESREGFPTESVFQQESAEIMEEAMDIGSDKCSDDIEETDNKTHFEYGVHFAAEPHYDEIPKYVESGYGDLYTHQEEDEEIFDEDLQESKNLIENNKQMFSDLDVLLGPKLYTKSGEHDDSSMSSLQEFERLEAEIATGRKLSQGSVDSLNGRPSISKSGEHDDVSMNSLTEFERLERECAEAERIESVAREEAARLSEIEEGHESQASETSQETLSGPEDMDSIDSDDYEKRLSEIDEIIRQAQTNVESFQVEPMPKQSLKSIRKTEIKSLSESLEKDIRPIDQIPSPTPKEQDSDSLDGNLNNIVLMQKETKELDICITELTPAKSSLTVESHDANEDSLNEDQDNSLEHDSLHEVKDHEQDSLKEDKTGDVDSLQEDQKILMQDSLYEEKDLDEDSLRESLELPKDELDVSQLSDKGIDTVEFDDSLHEECIASSKYLEHEPKFIPSLISSTDSLEPSSSTAATHATYQFETDSIMSSSLNSIQTSGEETLMASSTDSLDPNRMMQAYRNVVDSQLRRDTQDMYLDYEGNVQSAPDQTKSYMDKEGNIHPVSEIVKKLDVTNQTCVLNVSEEDQNIIDSIEESKTIKSLKDDTTSSKEYVSLDTTRIQSNVVTKDLSLTLTKDDVQDEEIDEEGNIIEKGKSPDVMHDSDEDDKDQTSISEDSLQKQVEDRFSDTKVISSRKGGEQVEEIKTVDELGNIRIIRRIRHIVTVQRDELSNPDIEKSEQAEPEVEETRTTDDKGNVKIIRRSRRIIKMPDSQSSDIDKHLQEFVQKSSVSDDSQITSPDVSQTDSLQEKYFQDPRCESPITRDMLSGRESVASIRSDFSDADSEIREIKTTDEKGNIIIRRIRRIVTPLPPDSNPSSGRESPYLKEPSETVEERRTVDEKGNVIIKRIRRIVKVQTKDTSETSPIPLVDNEELAKSDTACEESEPEECKFVDEDGNIKHIRRIKKIIKIPQTSNDEEALINDLLQKSEISDSISESSETFYKSDSKLINHVDHGGEETEKHLVQVKKSSSDDTQEPSIEEKFKDFLKKSIAQDSKDEKHEERIIDDKGNVVIIRTVKTSKVSEPKIHSQKFTGPDAEKQSLEFIKSFDTLHSTSQLQQYEATDGEGNIVRVTQEISAQPHVHSVSFSGESYEQDMESYMKNYEEKMHSSEPGSSPSISKSPTSVSNINVPYSTMKTTTHSVDESPIHTLSGTVSSSDTLPIHHEETKLMSEEIDNKELVQSYDSDDAIDSEEDEIIDYLKRGTSSFKEVEPPSDSKNGYSEESAKQL